MKNKIVTFLAFAFLIFFSPTKSFSKTCKPWIRIDSTFSVLLYNLTFAADTFFNPGDSIKLDFIITTKDLACGNVCQPGFSILEKNNTMISQCGFGTCNFEISDTGNYTISIGIQLCLWPNTIDTFRLFYNVLFRSTTFITENKNGNEIFLYPSQSNGIFKIKSSNRNLKNVIISNCFGDIVFSSGRNFSEIDLTNFSTGIYFYAIIDDKGNIFRGRIVKD